MSIFYAYEPRFTCNVCLSGWWEKLCEACWKLGGRGLKDLDRDGGYMLFNGPRRSLTLVGEAVHIHCTQHDETSVGKGKTRDETWKVRNGDS